MIMFNNREKEKIEKLEEQVGKQDSMFNFIGVETTGRHWFILGDLFETNPKIKKDGVLGALITKVDLILEHLGLEVQEIEAQPSKTVLVNNKPTFTTNPSSKHWSWAELQRHSKPIKRKVGRPKKNK
jgi:hypothetical protein